jgi:hypothetical protein
MNNEWIATLGGVATLVGAGAGGLLVNFGSKCQFQRERDWRRDQFLQEKLADIAALAEEIDQASRKLYGDAILLVENSQPLKMERPIPLTRLKTLIDFYAPQLHDHCISIVQVRDSTGEFVGQAIATGPLSTEQRQRLNLELIRGAQRMTEACESLAGLAAKFARQRLKLDAGS